MAQKRTRIMYASQSVRANGHLLYRVQTLGSNTTFTAEDVFELGSLDRVDVVDDVPAVAVALDTNEWGAVNSMAVLAGMNPLQMQGQPTVSGAYLRTNASCTGSGVRYYHGVSLSDFTLCNGVKIWAPVQNEASLGTADNDIQMTLFMDKVYVNSVTLTYNVGANATENYAAETDNKMWLVNNAKFVSQEEWDILAPSNSQVINLGLEDVATIPILSSCRRGFLAWTSTGDPAVIVKKADERDGVAYKINETAAAASEFYYDSSSHTLTLPTDAATLWPATAAHGYKFVVIYAASAYASSTAGGSDSDRIFAKYFEPATSTAGPDMPADMYPEDLGAVRQGQIEAYVVDPDLTTTWDMTLRMQTVTITATPTRTPLNELGHLRPFARPMNFPVEITVATTSMASDLERWAIAAGLSTADYEAGGSGTDIALNHLMSKQNLLMVVKVYQQTDEEAGQKNGLNRLAMLSSMDGDEYYDWDGMGVYDIVTDCGTSPRERALKTIVVQGLKIQAENYNNAVGGGGGGGGGSATQEMNFRATNKLFVVKGDVHIDDVACLERNSAANQF
jgi:hypothetical protein